MADSAARAPGGGSRPPAASAGSLQPVADRAGHAPELRGPHAGVWRPVGERPRRVMMVVVVEVVMMVMMMVGVAVVVVVMMMLMVVWWWWWW